MRTWLRRIRGAIGTGFTWGAVWSVIGGMPRWVLGINTDVPIPVVLGVSGFLAGVLFSTSLTLIERRRSFEQMSLPRFAVWGAISGLLLAGGFARAASLGWGDVRLIAPTFALATMVCASGSLALARRAVQRELPDAQGNAGAAGLTGQEKRSLRRGAD